MNYFSRERGFVISLILTAIALLTVTSSGQAEARYEITVTNLTRGQQFTPILVATHKSNVSLFTLGSPASTQLATLAEEGDTAPLTAFAFSLRMFLQMRLAEEGDTAPLTALLSSDTNVLNVTTAGGLLNPGASRTIVIAGRGTFDRISMAAMLIPTNDGFFAVNDMELPSGKKGLTLFSVAYDSGTERNDELCASIPGPDFIECGGPGGGQAPSGGEEGFVHVHSGIHGVGDLNPALRDWQNPIARISIRRLD